MPSSPERLTLPPDPRSPRRARRRVSQVVAERGWEDLDPAATLLVAELVTNVVLHAGTQATVTVRADQEVLRVEVADDDPTLPEVRRFGPESVTGRGLRIVEQLADRWGVERGTTGKVVWFELRHHGEGARTRAARSTPRDGARHDGHGSDAPLDHHRGTGNRPRSGPARANRWGEDDGTHDEDEAHGGVLTAPREEERGGR